MSPKPDRDRRADWYRLEAEERRAVHDSASIALSQAEKFGFRVAASIRWSFGAASTSLRSQTQQPAQIDSKTKTLERILQGNFERQN